MAAEANKTNATSDAAKKTVKEVGDAYVKEKGCTTFGQKQSTAVLIRVLKAEGFVEEDLDKEQTERLYYLIHPLTNSAAMARTLGFGGNGRAGVPDVSELL
jgi:hypothetical protein